MEWGGVQASASVVSDPGVAGSAVAGEGLEGLDAPLEHSGGEA